MRSPTLSVLQVILVYACTLEDASGTAEGGRMKVYEALPVATRYVSSMRIKAHNESSRLMDMVHDLEYRKKNGRWPTTASLLTPEPSTDGEGFSPERRDEWTEMLHAELCKSSAGKHQGERKPAESSVEPTPSPATPVQARQEEECYTEKRDGAELDHTHGLLQHMVQTLLKVLNQNPPGDDGTSKKPTETPPPKPSSTVEPKKHDAARAPSNIATATAESVDRGTTPASRFRPVKGPNARHDDGARGKAKDPTPDASRRRETTEAAYDKKPSARLYKAPFSLEDAFKKGQRRDDPTESRLFGGEGEAKKTAERGGVVPTPGGGAKVEGVDQRPRKMRPKPAGKSSDVAPPYGGFRASSKNEPGRTTRAYEEIAESTGLGLGSALEKFDRPAEKLWRGGTTPRAEELCSRFSTRVRGTPPTDFTFLFGRTDKKARPLPGPTLENPRIGEAPDTPDGDRRAKGSVGGSTGSRVPATEGRRRSKTAPRRDALKDNSAEGRTEGTAVLAGDADKERKREDETWGVGEGNLAEGSAPPLHSSANTRGRKSVISPSESDRADEEAENRVSANGRGAVSEERNSSECPFNEKARVTDEVKVKGLLVQKVISSLFHFMSKSESLGREGAWAGRGERTETSRGFDVLVEEVLSSLIRVLHEPYEDSADLDKRKVIGTTVDTILSSFFNVLSKNSRTRIVSEAKRRGGSTAAPRQLTDIIFSSLFNLLKGASLEYDESSGSASFRPDATPTTTQCPQYLYKTIPPVTDNADVDKVIASLNALLNITTSDPARGEDPNANFDEVIYKIAAALLSIMQKYGANAKGTCREGPFYEAPRNFDILEPEEDVKKTEDPRWSVEEATRRGLLETSASASTGAGLQDGSHLGERADNSEYNTTLLTSEEREENVESLASSSALLRLAESKKNIPDSTETRATGRIPSDSGTRQEKIRIKNLDGGRGRKPLPPYRSVPKSGSLLPTSADLGLNATDRIEEKISSSLYRLDDSSLARGTSQTTEKPRCGKDEIRLGYDNSYSWESVPSTDVKGRRSGVASRKQLVAEATSFSVEGRGEPSDESTTIVIHIKSAPKKGRKAGLGAGPVSARPPRLSKRIPPSSSTEKTAPPYGSTEGSPTTATRYPEKATPDPARDPKTTPADDRSTKSAPGATTPPPPPPPPKSPATTDSGKSAVLNFLKKLGGFGEGAGASATSKPAGETPDPDSPPEEKKEGGEEEAEEEVSYARDSDRALSSLVEKLRQEGRDASSQPSGRFKKRRDVVGSGH